MISRMQHEFPVFVGSGPSAITVTPLSPTSLSCTTAETDACRSVTRRERFPSGKTQQTSHTASYQQLADPICNQLFNFVNAKPLFFDCCASRTVPTKACAGGFRRSGVGRSSDGDRYTDEVTDLRHPPGLSLHFYKKHQRWPEAIDVLRFRKLLWKPQA